AELAQQHLRRGATRVGLAPPDHLAHAVARLQDVFEVVEISRGADLGIVEQTDDRAAQRRERRRQLRRVALGVEAWIEDSERHPSPPVRVVTASAFAPYHGGTTTPKPPAGPPAATTSRSSGERSAVYTASSSLRPATAALPTLRHSRRVTRAPSNTNSRMSFLVKPAAVSTWRCCVGTT